MLYIGIVPASPHSSTLYSVGEYIYLAFGMAIIFQELSHLSRTSASGYYYTKAPHLFPRVKYRYFQSHGLLMILPGIPQSIPKMVYLQHQSCDANAMCTQIISSPAGRTARYMRRFPSIYGPAYHSNGVCYVRSRYKSRSTRVSFPS